MYTSDASYRLAFFDVGQVVSLEEAMEGQNAISLDDFLFNEGADPILHPFLGLFVCFEGSEFDDELGEGSKWLPSSDFGDDQGIELCFAGIPADDDEFLGGEVSTCSLHLMMWRFLKAK